MRSSRSRLGDERGQAHTLEAIAAAMLLLASLGFALQMTIVTPLSASTSSQHIETQMQATAEGVLATAAETGALHEAVVFWNNSAGSFNNASNIGYYTSDPPENEFGRMLNRSFDQRGIAYNVYVTFQTPDGNVRTRRMVYRGVPTENAVSATRTIVLTDDTRLVDLDGTLNETTIENSSTFYVQDIQQGSPFDENGLFNTVRVEVVVWRI